MNEALFRDYFSGHADRYAAHRPGYPAALYAFLAGQCPGRNLCWDCATGNGQAAVELSGYFDQVLATDSSAEQISHAQAHKRIEYRVANATHSELEAASVDLVTVAQALHWFDIAAFSSELTRVLRPGGVLAVWCYNLSQIADGIDRALIEFSETLLGPYWPPQRELVRTA